MSRHAQLLYLHDDVIVSTTSFNYIHSFIQRRCALGEEPGLNCTEYAGIGHNHGPGKAQEASLDIIVAILFAYE